MGCEKFSSVVSANRVGAIGWEGGHGGSQYNLERDAL